MHKEQGRTVESPVESRAGFLDRPVLVVLAVSIVLAVLAFIMVGSGFFGGSAG